GRIDDVHGDAMACLFKGERAAKRDHARLGSGIGGDLGLPESALSSYRTDIDDPPPALSPHGGQRILRRVEHAEEIGGKDRVPLGDRRVDHGFPLEVSYIVHQNIEPSEMSNYGLQQLFGPAPVGDIGRNGKVLWAGRETARCFELVKNFL